MRASLTVVVATLIAAVAMTGLSLGTPTPVSAQVERQYLLLGMNSTLPAGLDTMVASVGGRTVNTYGEIGVAVVVSADPAFPVAASALPGVQSVVPDGTMGVDADVSVGDVATMDPVVEPEGVTPDGVPSVNPSQWYIKTIAADQAWSRGFQGRGVRVAVLDTGIDYMHQELRGHIDLTQSISLLPIGWQPNPLVPSDIGPGGREMHDSLGRVVPASVQSFADLQLVLDPHGRLIAHSHGTHVASVIAGAGVRAPGVAPQATLIAVKVIDKTGTGPESAVIAGILYAARIHADVINMSLGFVLPRGGVDQDGDSDGEWVHSQLLEALLRATSFARQQGSLMVASAGNTGSNIDLNRTIIKAPAGIKPVVGVSATDASCTPPMVSPIICTSLDRLASFSDYGRSVVFVAAPGVAIFGAANTYYFRPQFDRKTGRWLYPYVAMSGTSAAAAQVSGVAALIAGKSGGQGEDEELRAMLCRATDRLGSRGRSIYFGCGRVNALKGVTLTLAGEEQDHERGD